MHVDEVVGLIIQQYYAAHPVKQTMSRHRLACTRCRTLVSSTWRPGPCGTASLCNRCGVQYMRRQGKPRMIDLIREGDRTLWVQRDPKSFQWQETYEADMKDRRIRQWSNHETERLEYIQRKKRKFVHL